MIVLGIDPGLATTGFGLIKTTSISHTYIAHGQIKTDVEMPHNVRLLKIYNDIENIINKFSPNVISIEDLFFNRNTTSAISVAQAMGVVFLLSAQHNIPAYAYSPRVVKQTIVGNGTASKQDVQRFVSLLLGVPTESMSDHETDALAIAICHAHQRGGYDI
ncbi:crossover junction endodeoxyribonuclease RuvC [Spirochaetia bacterium 38H-sp]|uniref:Crossover junction endodeoxyribonuclease RuvC n=1 Tax=Rarispira pelagica TaxID=3141764 RepID=A0ABU9UBA9_9SPIR